MKRLLLFTSLTVLLSGAPGVAAEKTGAVSIARSETYLPWTVHTDQPVRYAPAIALTSGAQSNLAQPGAVAQSKYEAWLRAGARDFVNAKRRHWLMLYCALYNWKSFYTDENVRPKDPANPNDPGYSWRLFDELLGIDAVKKDGVKWLIRINWQSWGEGAPPWLIQGQGVVNNEDNGLGGGMRFPHGKANNEGLPAFQRVYVQKEFSSFARAFGQRYRDRAEIGGLIFDEIQLGEAQLIRASDLKDDVYYRAHDEAMLDFARQMPHTALCVYQVGQNSRRQQLAQGVNIGFGCADARLWNPPMSTTSPWYPDDPPARQSSGYYTSAQIYNIAAKQPVGGSRHFWVCGSENYGWIQTGPIPPACGDEHNILGLPAGTMKTPAQITPEYFLQYNASVPRHPGGAPGLNSVPGLVPASWLILDDNPHGRAGAKLSRSMSQWAEAIGKLGPKGLDCLVQEPDHWDDELKRVQEP